MLLRFLNFIAYLKRNQRINVLSKPAKLNVGSGLLVTDGWINIDSSHHTFFSKYPNFVLKEIYKRSLVVKELFSLEEYYKVLKDHTFIYHNVEYGLPFHDKSVDFIYSSHFLEHLFKDDAVRFLEESYRVLKVEGIIRIGVPDLDSIISCYQQGDKELALESLFTVSRAKYGYFSSHKWMYDFDSLKLLLVKVGFVDIKRCQYREGETPDLNKLDNRPEHTIFVEAKREL